MNCHEVRERLLEADLGGTEDEALGRHLESCEGCAELLDRLIEGQARLGTALAGAAATVAADIDPARVRAGITRSRGIPWRRIWVPLAAAAAIAGVAFFGLRERPSSGAVVPPEWALPNADLASIRPVIESGSHDKVAVLPTENPDITVVWFMDS